MFSFWPLLLAICTRLAELMTSVEGQNRIFFGLVNTRQFVRCVAKVILSCRVFVSCRIYVTIPT